MYSSDILITLLSKCLINSNFGDRISLRCDSFSLIFQNMRVQDMVIYKAFSERMTHPEQGEYTTYGIAAVDADGKSRVIHDVTCDKEKALALAEAFGEEQLSLSQLDEAVESFLYNFEV